MEYLLHTNDFLNEIELDFYMNSFKLAKTMNERDKEINSANYEDSFGNSCMTGFYLGYSHKKEEECERLRENGRRISENLSTNRKEFICRKAMIDAGRI
jgi:hypothetical protein